jgi:hypothetical protein
MNRLLNLFLLIFILAFYSACDTKKKKELAESFSSFHARKVPANIFNITKLNEFDILSQGKNSTHENYDYPNTFVVGLYNDKTNIYDRKHVIEGFSPVENYNLIKIVSDFYTTDTTYLDNIQLTDTVNVDNKDIYLLKDTSKRISQNEIQTSFKLNSKKYLALIYRKTNTLLRDRLVGEFMMWKREIITYQNDTLKTERLQIMNEHVF